jgi:hypothetical protein
MIMRRISFSSLGEKPRFHASATGSVQNFALLVVAADVDVHRLAAVEAVEVEPVRPVNPANCRHLELNRIVSDLFDESQAS